MKKSMTDGAKARGRGYRSLLDMVDSLLSLVGAPVCAGCGEEAAEGPGLLLGPRCHASLQVLPSVDLCQRCGEPLLGRDQWCLTCRDRTPAPLWYRSVWWYRGAAREALHHAKFQGHRWGAIFFARLLVEVCAAPQAWFPGLSAEDFRRDGRDTVALCGVPASPGGRFRRGYDLVADSLRVAGMLCGGSLDIRPLVARSRGRSQKGLGAADRQTNLAHQLGLRGGAVPRRILLVDDVCTTGATMEACAAVLLAGGAAEVRGLSFFRD